MTNDTKAPERLVTSKCGKTIVHDGMKRFDGDIEWVPYDLHLARIKGIYEDAQSGCQAALEARDKRIREKALREALTKANIAAEESDEPIDVVMAIAALIEKEQTGD